MNESDRVKINTLTICSLDDVVRTRLARDSRTSLKDETRHNLMSSLSIIIGLSVELKSASYTLESHWYH